MNAANLAAAVSAAVDLMNIASAFGAQAQRISAKIAAAESAGLDRLSDEDWNDILAKQAAARAALAKALGDAP